MNSLLSLLLAVLIVFGLETLIKKFAIILGSFEGTSSFLFFETVCSSDTWSTMQVLLIYLLPFAFNLMIFILLSLKFSFPLRVKPEYRLLFSWLYTLFLVKTFIMPVLEIIERKEIYFALNYLNFSHFEMIIFSVMLMAYFIYRLFRISALFAMEFPLTFNRGKKNIKHLIYLWLIPLVLISSVSLFISPAPLLFFVFCASALMINTPYILRYDVIVV